MIRTGFDRESDQTLFFQNERPINVLYQAEHQYFRPEFQQNFFYHSRRTSGVHPIEH